MTDQQPLTFDEYQRRARETAIYPQEYATIYPALGLVGEVGEVCERIKKGIRDYNSAFDCEAITKELGDCLWYCAALAEDIGVGLSEIAMRQYVSGSSLLSIPPDSPYMLVEVVLQMAAWAGRAAYDTHGRGYSDEIAHASLKSDIQGVMLQAAYIASYFDFTLEDIARANLAKLADRAVRDKLHGEGDDR